MGSVTNLADERARRRPRSADAKLIAIAETLEALRQEASGVLFLPAEELRERLGLVAATLLVIAADLSGPRFREGGR